MNQISKSALVVYSARQMYELVDAIDHYPEFLPWCRSSEVLTRTDKEVTAKLEIAYSGLHKSFTTRNTMEPGRLITMQLVEGPFKKLDGIWAFEQLGEQGSKVSLDLEFTFSNRILAATIGPAFGKIATSLVDAFTKRAVQVYGRS